MNLIKGIAFFTYNGNLNEKKGTKFTYNLNSNLIVNTLPMHYEGTLSRLKNIWILTMEAKA